jgi:twitching motility protein PilT
MSNTLPAEFETLLMEAQARGASDLHLLPGEPPTLRVDGVLERTEAAPLTAAETMEIASALISRENVDRIGRELGETHRSVTIGEVAARICVARASGEVTIAVRLLPTSVPGVEALRVPKGLVAAVNMPNGLIVISGRAGSGKSTTAYSLLDHINASRRANIHTFEDPIMYRLTPKISLVQQREVGVDIPDTLSGLKQSMLMDPDVVFVGEIRTLDDLQACITVAEVGHLVIIVIHAETPEGAIQRIVDVFPEHTRPFYRKVLAGVLRCVSCQRLIPNASGRGRIAAYGLLVPDEEMRTAIAEGGDVLSRRTPLPENCLSMRGEIERMASEGLISRETAKAYLADI